MEEINTEIPEFKYFTTPEKRKDFIELYDMYVGEISSFVELFDKWKRELETQHKNGSYYEISWEISQQDSEKKLGSSIKDFVEMTTGMKTTDYVNIDNLGDKLALCKVALSHGKFMRDLYDNQIVNKEISSEDAIMIEKLYENLNKIQKLKSDFYDFNYEVSSEPLTALTHYGRTQDTYHLLIAKYLNIMQNQYNENIAPSVMPYYNYTKRELLYNRICKLEYMISFDIHAYKNENYHNSSKIELVFYHNEPSEK